MRTFLSTCAALSLLVGCATQPAADVTTYYDDFTGLRTDLLADNLLESSSTAKPREVVWLNASRVFTAHNQASYYLEVTYMATAEVGWLDIPFGQTLTLILDGRTLNLMGSGSANLRKVTRENLVSERCLFEVTKKQLQEIAAARKVEVKVRGKNGLIEREFGPANYEKFRLFVITYAG